MSGPGAAEAAASFREMLKATRTGQRRTVRAPPAAKAGPGGQALAVAQGLPTLPVAGPVDATDIDLLRIVVEGGSSDGPSGEPAAPRVAVPHHTAPAQAGADGGVGSGDGPGPVGSLSGPVDPDRWAGTGAAAGGLAGVAVGGGVGAVAGAAAGAAGGTLVVPGVGTVGGAVVGAVAGAAEGAAVAGAAGAVVGGEAGKLAGEFVNYIEGKEKRGGAQSAKGSQQTKATSDDPLQDPKIKAREAQIKDNQKDIDKFKGMLDKEHHDAARREQKGEAVKINPRDGEPFDHENEVEEVWRGFRNTIEKIKRQLGYPHLDDAQRAALMDQLAQASRVLDQSKQFVRGRQ